jgi:hypothetical protein
MKNLLITLILTLTASLVYSQARVVINNNGFIVIDNSAFLVLANSNTNALATTGTGGNIVSEDELDVIKWDMAAVIGTYTVPWTTGTGVKIPLTINKTSAGSGAGTFILSNWLTAANNVPLPALVTNMNSTTGALPDNSLYVIDRFWHIDAQVYAVKPDVTLGFGYDPVEFGGTNTITEANLQAQRFNTGSNDWEGLVYGTGNPVTNTVTGVVVPSATFFVDWTLTDNFSPLPVTLVSFEATCQNSNALITWTTATEINNDYFMVEKSYDGASFFELTTIQGAGNSNTLLTYSAVDNNPTIGTVYYRLKQVDFDGTTEYHQIVSASCVDTERFTVNNLVLSNNNLGFSITAKQEEDIAIYFYDYRGRMISNKVQQIESGNNLIELNNLKLSTGIYMLYIIGDKNNYSTKLMSKRN